MSGLFPLHRAATPASSARTDDLQALQRFLLDPPAALPSLGLLRTHRLSGYAYMQLPASHPGRAALRPDYTAALYAHVMARTALRGLLRAWQEAGITAMLFKGFQLSEFVYSSPGQRHYGDVDLRIPPEQAALASSVAQGLGWKEHWNRDRSMTPFHHELLGLHSPDGWVRVDVHERIVHNLLPHVEHQRRVTGQVWAAAGMRDWDGLQVRLPCPEDQILVGLVLNRCWGDDSWRIGTHDPMDFRAVVERSGLTVDDLRRRALELGCQRTLEIYLTLCNPWTGSLRLRSRTRLQVLGWGLRVAPERGPLLVEHLLSKAWVMTTKVTDLLREFPGVVRVTRQLRQPQSMATLTGRLLGPVGPRRRSPNPFEVQRVIRGVHLNVVLLKIRPEGHCLPRSLAIAAALRRRGFDAVFRSGVRREGDQILSHAWVELDGAPVFDAQEEQNAHLYTPNFRAPDTSAD